MTVDIRRSHTAPDFRQGLMGRPLRSKSVGVRAKVRLEDSFEDQLQCPLHHAIADTGDLKRSDFAVALRDLHRGGSAWVCTCL